MPPESESDDCAFPDRPDPDVKARALESSNQKLEVISQASELLRPFLRDPTKAPQAATQIMAVMESHKGPLPHPRILGGYDAVIPGAAREILDMAKAEQAHRHRMDNRETAYPYFGMAGGLLCLLSCIGGSIFIAAQALDASIALTLIGAPVLTGIGWLINSRLPAKTAPVPQRDAGFPTRPASPRKKPRR